MCDGILFFVHNKSEVLPSLSLINHHSMVEYVCNLFLAVACFLGYIPIDVGSADGVIDLAIKVA